MQTAPLIKDNNSFTKKPDNSAFIRTLHWIILLLSVVSLSLAIFFYVTNKRTLAIIFSVIFFLLIIFASYTFYKMFPYRVVGH